MDTTHCHNKRKLWRYLKKVPPSNRSMLAMKDIWCSTRLPFTQRVGGRSVTPVGSRQTACRSESWIRSNLARPISTVSWSRKERSRLVSSVTRMLKQPGEPPLQDITRRRICFTQHCGKYSARTSTRGARSLMMRSFGLIFPTLKRSPTKNSIRSSSGLMRKFCATRRSSPKKWR